MVEFKILKDHKEWLKNRNNGIGGSEASCIVGLNPYKNNIDLWLEKTGQVEPEDISDREYVRYGTQAERHLRGLFRLDFPEYELSYYDNNSFYNDKYPFALASLDGWLIDKDGRKGVLEIKTTNILQSMQKEKWKNQLPDNYYIQLLHYMAVIEADFAILVAQLKSEFKDEIYKQTKHYYIERKDVEEDINYLMEKEAEFWEYVKSGKQPALILPEI